MCDSMITSIESVKKFFIKSNSVVGLKVIIDGNTVYNICQEYPLGYSENQSIPFNEELEIEIKVIRKVVE